jgi:hypothetical protein
MAIELTIVVDTASLGSGQGSTWDKPAGCEHKWAFMITDTSHVAGNGTSNGTADLELKSSVGDQLRIWGASMSSQFQDEVFIYDFKFWKGDRVLDVQGMRPQTFNQHAMVPQPGNPSHRPPEFSVQERAFNCNLIDITNAGKEWFYVTFMVFGPVKDAQGNREIKGYFQWDPSISAI